MSHQLSWNRFIDFPMIKNETARAVGGWRPLSPLVVVHLVVVIVHAAILVVDYVFGAGNRLESRVHPFPILVKTRLIPKAQMIRHVSSSPPRIGQWGFPQLVHVSTSPLSASCPSWA
jgi:hypothetical protein